MLVYAKNYEESDGTIASSPNLRKGSSFGRLFENENCCADLDLQLSFWGLFSRHKNHQASIAKHSLTKPIVLLPMMKYLQQKSMMK